MINKKAEFGLQKFMIAMLLFSAIFGLFYIYVADMNTTYEDYAEPIINEEYSTRFDKFAETKEDVSGMYAEIRNTKAGFTFIGATQIVLRSFIGVVQFGYGALGDLSLLVANFGEIFGIPSTISNILLTVIFLGITVTIIILVINAIATRGSGKL